MSDLGGYPDREEHWLGGRRPSMRPPPRIQSRVAIALVALVVGFLVAVQAAGSGDRPLSRLAAERPEDLTRILADLNAEADELARELSTLRVKLARYQSSARSDDLALRDARKSLADLQVLSGLVPVEGPGVAVRIEDPQAQVGWEGLLDLVQELRDAGAEAIAVNGRRVIASTWFGPADGGGMVDGTRIVPPYELEAIGPGDVIAQALGIPGGPVSVLSALPGVTATVREVDGVLLPRAAAPAP
ncbi:MAG: DUF881 domain-containing protein [Actinomycetota bacterium]